MNGWSATSYAISTATVLEGVVANSPVSKEFPISAGGSLNLVVKIKASAVTVSGAITAKLQTAIGNDWVDSKTATITADGNVYIKLNVQTAADQTFLPLLNKGRLVITTTDAGDEVTVNDVQVLQEL